MSLLTYWPEKEEVDRCIKSEAETVSDEVLLAVHQEFPLAYSKVGPDGRVVTDSRQLASEDDFLRCFLGSAPEGSLIVPVTGASGVGKSHLIRILDARLRRLPNASNYLVIRIPKSASLRRVVELILEAEPLQDSSYDTIRAEFEKALSDVPLSQAVILFQAQLRIALGDYATTLHHQLLQSPTDESMKRRLHVARGLPLLLSDAATETYFHEQVLSRIIHRSVEGLKDPNAPINPTDSQFKATDFEFPDNVEISKAAIQVRNFYLQTLNTFNKQGMVIAADVLNQVVDQATRQLYKLNESLGGKTLGEVIGDIRRLLLAKDPHKELIILVEDFAALVGIQDTLAKILVQHGETDGRKTLATIRSAIAVTDGYLAGRDTLATRAGREWVVESRFESEAEVLLRTRMLVASYLNAARHGEALLKNLYKTQFDAPSNTHRWSTPIFSEGSGDHETILEAFGKIQEIPLFPFTEQAINSLARSTLTAGNTLVFNPRFVIKNVIREVLLNGRDAYTNNQFPPPGIGGKPLAAEVAQWLALQPFSADIKKRYERFISVWGNQPTLQSDISRINGLVFETFGLPLPVINTEISITKPVPPETKNRSTKTEEPDGNVRAIQTYRDALERWVQNGTLLEQKIANEIRQGIAKLMNQNIDWNAERFLKRNVIHTLFSLPNAGGEGHVDADPVKVAESTEDADGRMRGDLLALLRYDKIYSAAADYEDVDEDIARIGNLIDRLRPGVLTRLRSTTIKQARSAISLLATNSRLLGLSERGRTPAAISAFLFGDVKPLNEFKDTAPQAFKDWRQLQRDASEIRTSLIQQVLETSGCFQGSGKTPQAVDIVGLLECYPNETGIFDLTPLSPLSPELRSTLMSMRPAAIGGRVKQVVESAKKAKTLIVNELGPEFDKQAVIDTVKSVAMNLSDMGAWSHQTIGFSSKAFMEVCESFRGSAVKEAFAALADLLTDAAEESSDMGKKISRLAQMPLDPLLIAQKFIGDACTVVRAAADHARTLEKQYEGVSPVQTAAKLSEAFTNLIDDLGSLK